MEVVTNIDFDKKPVDVPFPYFVLPELNQTTPLVVKALEAGDIPVIGILGGAKKVIAKVSPSVLNVDKLLRTHGRVTYMTGQETSYQLNSVLDYLEAIWI